VEIKRGEFMKRYIRSSSYVEDGRYVVRGYFGTNYSGLADDFQSDDWSAIEDHAHEMLSDGDYVEIEDLGTGKSVRLDPDSYFDGFEGEFPVKPWDLDEHWA
jgi:hypothetical protein